MVIKTNINRIMAFGIFAIILAIATPYFTFNVYKGNYVNPYNIL